MSKLIDKLRAAARGEQPRLGFGFGARTGKAPGIGLLAAVEADRDLAHAAAEVADAVIVRADRDAALAIKEALGAAICGVDLSDDARLADAAADSGFDFVVLGAGSSVAALKVGESDKLIRLPIAASDGMLQALSTLPIEAVIPVEAATGALTIAHLLDYMRLVALTRKPILLAVGAEFPAEHLVTLRDASVAGVVVEVRRQEDLELLKRFRATIDSFPRPPKRERERDAVALAPAPTVARGRDDREAPEPEDE